MQATQRNDDERDQSLSLWMDDAAMPQFQPLDANRRVEICVVGGGLAGLTTAYLLGREGRRVLLLDDGALGEDRRSAPPPT